jgi:hypothetical protein
MLYMIDTQSHALSGEGSALKYNWNTHCILNFVYCVWTYIIIYNIFIIMHGQSRIL